MGVVTTYYSLCLDKQAEARCGQRALCDRVCRLVQYNGHEERLVQLNLINPLVSKRLFLTVLLCRFLARVRFNQFIFKFQDWFTYVLLICV
jgi:hypothetical protein